MRISDHMNMKKAALAVVAMIFLVSAGQTAYACSCKVDLKKEKINYKKWLKSFDGAAFTGRVATIETEEEESRSKVTFAVSSYWHGVESAEVVIYTPSSSGLCGIDYSVGEEYTVIADRDEDGLQVFLCSELRYREYREGFLEVLGEAKFPPKPSDHSARKIDEFGDIPCDDELARLDSFLNDLNGNPDSTGYIVVYGGRKGKRDEAKARLARISYYLEKNRGLAPVRFVTVDGGFRESLMGELWIVDPGDEPPVPAYTVADRSVRLKGRAKVRGYSCGDEMGN